MFGKLIINEKLSVKKQRVVVKVILKLKELLEIMIKLKYKKKKNFVLKLNLLENIVLELRVDFEDVKKKGIF